MSQEHRTGRAARGEEQQRPGGELPAHVRLARHLARARQTRERFGPPAPGAPTLSVTPATDAPGLPARELPPQKAHPTDSDDAPPLPPREAQGAGQ
jgi:hypothetical protein